jgi:hypothetical protein
MENIVIKQYKNSNGTFDYWLFDSLYSLVNPVGTFIDVNKDAKSILNELKKGYSPKKIKFKELTPTVSTKPITTSNTKGVKSTKENLEKVFDQFFGN